MSKTHHIEPIIIIDSGGNYTSIQVYTPKKRRIPRKDKKRYQKMVERLKNAVNNAYRSHGIPESWLLSIKK